MISEEQRIQELEDKIAQMSLRQIHYPLDFESQKTLFSVFNRRLNEFLHPQDTDDVNDGTFIAINNTPAIQFADNATKVAYFSFMPHEVPSISSMEFIWSTPATSGNLRWQIDIGEGGKSDATNVRTTGGTAISTAADGTANELSYTDILNASGVNIKKLKKNLLGIKFTRLGADAADTLTNTVNLYGILVKYNLYA